MRFTVVLFALVATLTFALPAGAALPIPVSSLHEGIQLQNSTDNGLTLFCGLPAVESMDVATVRGNFTRISIPGYALSQRLGEPALPVSRQIIAVPLNAEVAVEVLDYNRQEVALSDYDIQNPIFPAQPSLAKNQAPADIPFAYEPAAYSTPGYGDRPLVHVEELGILRGVRLCVLVIEPVRYDPVLQQLEIFTDLTLDVAFRGGDLQATSELRASTFSPYFESIYSSAVLNYRRDRSALDEDLTRYPIKYVIIADAMFTAQLQPFIQWKTRKGYEVIVGYTNDPQVGSTTTSIKAYLQGLYNAGTPEDPAPSFVLFVGDIAQIPAWAGTAGSHSTDLHYARLSGTDIIPDIYYGRFSASNTTDLQPQLDKTLEYEQYLFPNPAFLGEAVMIAGVDGSFGQVWANGQINYGTANYFNAAHGIASHTHLYPGSGSQDALIVSEVSDGAGYVNYTAHGSETSWADPTFTIANINALANAHEYPTVVGNCCLTNSFQVATCMGEAWLRAANKGAVGYIGASNNSYWDEDYWWGVGHRTNIVEFPTYDAARRGAYDGMFHDHTETFPNWYTAQYAFNMAGNLAVVQSGTSRINYYWEIYHLMGDPSLSTFFGIPTANTVTYPDVILLGLGQITVTADPYSYVGLSLGNELVAAGLVGADGSLTLDFEPFSVPGMADLVITRQNRIPVIAQIQVVPNDGPYLITSAVTMSDAAGGDGDGISECGEGLAYTLTEQNVGTVDAAGVMVSLSSADPYLNLTDGEQAYGTVAAGAEVAIPNGFAIALSINVPDGHIATVDITTTDNAVHTWTGEFALTACAPEVVITSVLVNDASGNNNGVLDPGETALLTLNLRNDGTVATGPAGGTLSTDYAFAAITQGGGTVALNPAQTGSLAGYTVSIDAAAPAMDRAFFYVEFAMGGGRIERRLFELVIGGFTESVENGLGGWTHEPNQTGWTDQWHISAEQFHSSSHAFKCGDTGTATYANHMDAVLTTPVINLSGPAELRFWHQMDGEISSAYPDSAYDAGILQISVNNGAWTQVTPTSGGYNKYSRCSAGGGNPYTGPFTCRTHCWSGTIAWSEVVCNLSSYTGDVRLRFRFGSDNGGGREGWYVDDIRISMLTGNNPPQNLTAELSGSIVTLAWESPTTGALTSVLEGYNVYRDGVLLCGAVQALTYDDNLAGLPEATYTYTVTAEYSDGESAASNAVPVVWANLPPNAVSDLTASPNGSDIILNWTPTDANFYYLYISLDGYTFTDPPLVVDAPPYTLVNGAAVYGKRFFVVTAVR